jgi:hypothetical protein
MRASQRVLWFGFLVLGLWASLATASFAQGEASIQGVVIDSTGGAIPGVAVRIKNLETGAERNQVTDGWSSFQGRRELGGWQNCGAVC